jgi:membrane protein DedA with SNARE-associated domain
VISILSALVYHFKVQNYLVASVLSAITASVLFQIIGYFVEGYLDPFFIVAAIVGGVVALIIAFVVGIPVSYFKKKKERRNDDHGNSS